jgi:hypothetical protein
MQKGAPVLVTCRQKVVADGSERGSSLAKSSLLAALSGAIKGAKLASADSSSVISMR